MKSNKVFTGPKRHKVTQYVCFLIRCEALNLSANNNRKSASFGFVVKLKSSFYFYFCGETWTVVKYFGMTQLGWRPAWTVKHSRSLLAELYLTCCWTWKQISAGIHVCCVSTVKLCNLSLSVCFTYHRLSVWSLVIYFEMTSHMCPVSPTQQFEVTSV